MQYRLLSPKQFEPLRSLMDILIVTTHSPWALSAKVPHGASDLIVRHIATMIQQRFMGRTVEVDLGVAFSMGGLDVATFTDSLPDFVPTLPTTLLLLDRVLLREHEIRELQNHNHVLAIDWWQWFRARVPEGRLEDAWLYLCLTHSDYSTSPEFCSLGMNPETANQMATYGRDLLSQFVSFACDTLISVLNQASDTPTE